jgi:hypothetical protein
MRRSGIVLAIGAAWTAAAIAVSAWSVPSDAAGYYLMDHGRPEHHATRFGAVGAFVVIGVLLVGVAAMILWGIRRAPGTAILCAAPPLLLAGLIPLSVTLMSRDPRGVWLPWLTLAGVALSVLAVLGAVAHTIRRAYRAQRRAPRGPRGGPR